MAHGRHLRKQQSTRQPKLRFAFFLLALVALVAVVWGTSMHPELPADAVPTETPAPTAAPTPTPEPTPLVETVRFSASGDNLIHEPIYKQAKRRSPDGNGYDFAFAYQNLAEFYQQFDVNWINQESLVSNEIPPATYPCFSTPGECAQALYDIGFRVFSLANNHSYDQGTKGISATLRFWDSMPEDTVTTGFWKGTEDYANIPVQEVNGIRIAYLAYTEHTNGIAMGPSRNPEATVIYTSELETIQSQVQQARQIADVVVVGVHWGIEYNNKASDAQKQLAQKIADWGADLIIGTHPHVLQDAQWLTAADGRQTFVAYSLGNFISTQNRTPRAVGGILTLDMVKTTELDGSVSVEIQTPKIHPVITHYGPGRSDTCVYLYRDYTPELAAKHGMNGYDSTFSFDRLREIAEEAVSPEFLDLN